MTEPSPPVDRTEPGPEPDGHVRPYPIADDDPARAPGSIQTVSGPSRRRWPTWLMVLLAVVATTALLAGGYAVARSVSGTAQQTAAATPSPPAPTLVTAAAPAEPQPRPHTITYEVTGTGRADLTINNPDGDTTEQLSGVLLPWSKTYRVDVAIIYVYVSAQRQSDDAGAITARILIDDVEQKTATSSGAFVIASCSGRYRA